MAENQEKELFTTLATLVTGVNKIQTDVLEIKETLNEHSQILSEHSQILDKHSQILERLDSKTGYYCRNGYESRESFDQSGKRY